MIAQLQLKEVNLSSCWVSSKNLESLLLNSQLRESLMQIPTSSLTSALLSTVSARLSLVPHTLKHTSAHADTVKLRLFEVHDSPVHFFVFFFVRGVYPQLFIQTLQKRVFLV